MHISVPQTFPEVLVLQYHQERLQFSIITSIQAFSRPSRSLDVLKILLFYTWYKAEFVLFLS